MKITVIHSGDIIYEDLRRLKTKIETEDGVESASFGASEPEYMNLSHDLRDAYKIEKMLKMAYDAGSRGEEYQSESVQEQITNMN